MPSARIATGTATLEIKARGLSEFEGCRVLAWIVLIILPEHKKDGRRGFAVNFLPMTPLRLAA